MPLKNPCGLRDGEVVYIDDVDRGKACNCICPSCKHPLIANKGESKQDYFSHASGSECGAGYQTALHMMAKDVLFDHKQLRLPRLLVRTDSTLWKRDTKGVFIEVVKSGLIFKFDTVKLESALGDIIPDVILEVDGVKLLVEIKVTHGVDDVKQAKIEALGISTIEFDFSQASRVITKKELKRALIDEYAPYGHGEGKWIYHRLEADAQERANREYEEQQANLVVTPPPVVVTPSPVLGPPPLLKKSRQQELF